MQITAHWDFQKGLSDLNRCQMPRQFQKMYVLNASLAVLMPLKISLLVTFQSVKRGPNHTHHLKALLGLVSKSDGERVGNRD